MRSRVWLRAVCLLFLGACTAPEGNAREGNAPGGSTKDQGAHAARDVKLVRVTEAPMARSIVASGTLAADERVTISTKVAGRVQTLLVDLGTEVRAGDVIATLEPTDYRLQVAQAESAVVQARAQLGLGESGSDHVDIDGTSLVKEAQATLDETTQRLGRADALLERRLIAQAEYDTIRAEHARAQSMLDSAREQVRTRNATLGQRGAELAAARQGLKDSVLRSPLDATVEERFTSVGEFLPVGTKIATLVRTSPLRLRVEVPERDSAAVRLDQAVRVRIEGDETVHTGRVARISPTLRTNTRTLTVEAELPNERKLLRAGSFARAEIVVQQDAHALTVPKSAIVTFAGVDKVLTVVDGKIVESSITTGRLADSLVEVLDGVEAGTEVVLEPGNLQQGQAVRVLGSN